MRQGTPRLGGRSHGGRCWHRSVWAGCRPPLGAEEVVSVLPRPPQSIFPKSPVVACARSSFQDLVPSIAEKHLNGILPAQKLGVEIKDFVLQPLSATLLLLGIIFGCFSTSVLASCDVCSQQWDAHQLMVSRGSLLQRSHGGATNVMPNSRLAHSGGNGRSSAQGHLQNLSEKQGKYK